MAAYAGKVVVVTGASQGIGKALCLELAVQRPKLILAWVRGSDPVLSKECILLGAHLDGTGRWPVLLPGANDNASGSAIVLALGRAFAGLKNKPKRSLASPCSAARSSGFWEPAIWPGAFPPASAPPNGWSTST